MDASLDGSVYCEIATWNFSRAQVTTWLGNVTSAKVALDSRDVSFGNWLGNGCNMWRFPEDFQLCIDTSIYYNVA